MTPLKKQALESEAFEVSALSTTMNSLGVYGSHEVYVNTTLLSTMNDSAQLAWKEEKAGIEYAKRIALHPLQLGYAPIYHGYFYLYLRWTLARIPTDSRPFPAPLTDNLALEDPRAVQQRTFFNRESIDVTKVGVFLEDLLGEQFEDIFGCKADADDYKYVADTLDREVKYLSPLPDTVAEAIAWLERGRLRLAPPDPRPSSVHLAGAMADEQEPLPTPPTFRWTGKKVELAELGYALVWSGLVEAKNREHFVQALSDFLDAPISAPANVISGAGESKKPRGAIFDILKRALDKNLKR